MFTVGLTFRPISEALGVNGYYGYYAFFILSLDV